MLARGASPVPALARVVFVLPTSPPVPWPVVRPVSRGGVAVAERGTFVTRVWLHTHLPRLQAGSPDMISVKAPGQRVGYASWVSVRDVRFVVHERGRQRCVRDGVRNVHAWVVGEEVLRVTSEEFTPVMDFPPPSYRQALYDPFKGSSFVDSETLEPVSTASWVIFSGKNVFYCV